MAAEFQCCDRNIIVITADVVPAIRLCAACQTIPGWYRFPQLRAVIDPDHDGLEIWEREADKPAVALPPRRGEP